MQNTINDELTKSAILHKKMTEEFKMSHKNIIDTNFNLIFPHIINALNENKFPFAIFFEPIYSSNEWPRMQNPFTLEFNAFVQNMEHKRNEEDKPILSDILKPLGIRNSSLHDLENPIWIVHAYFGKKASNVDADKILWKFQPEKESK